MRLLPAQPEVHPAAAGPESRITPPSRVRAWLVPDLAMVLAVITFFYVLIAFDGGQKLFRDSDTGWHIRTGESIIQTGSLPRTDPYSFSKAGEPWVTWEWAADVAMGFVHRRAGLAGVAILYAAAIAMATWLWVRFNWAQGGTFLVAALLVIPMLSTANLHWLARPHVFGWLLLLMAAERVTQNAWRWYAWLAFGALWANVHASFPLWIAICGVLAVGHLVRSWIWAGDQREDLARASYLVQAGAAFGIGTLINPYGWALHQHVVSYLMDRELIERIGEFQSFNFHVHGAGQIVAVVLIAMAGSLIAIGQGRIGWGLVGLMLVAAALRSARMLPVLALIALPIANGAITEWLRTARGLSARARQAIGGALDYSANLRTLELGARGWIWIPVALALGMLFARGAAARIGFPPDQFPVAAITQVPKEARLFAPDKFGGYIIYRENGARPVFFDGRSDFYGSAFMKEYIRIVEVRPGWQALFDRYQFTHALLPANYSLIPALEARGWKRTYADATAVVLARAKD